MERDRLDCANMLLDYAKSNGVSVTFKRRSDDLLSRAIASGSYTRVEFVLDKLTGKYGTLTETIELLKKHLSDFLSQFPKIAQRFLAEDRFTMEYARFEAPKALFGRNGKTPVGMSIDHHPESWATDSSAAKDLWIQNSKYGEKLSDTAGQKITVVAKIYCLALPDFWDMIELKCVYDSVRLS